MGCEISEIRKIREDPSAAHVNYAQGGDTAICYIKASDLFFLSYLLVLFIFTQYFNFLHLAA